MFDLQEIQKKISENYDTKQVGGVIISGFKKKYDLDFCRGIIFTEKKIEENIEELFVENIIGNPNSKILVVDIISNVNELKTTKELTSIDLLHEGIFVGDTKNDSGSFVLPETKGIDSIKKAIEQIKQKVEFSSKQINIYKFSTQRFTFEDEKK